MRVLVDDSVCLMNEFHNKKIIQQLMKEKKGVTGRNSEIRCVFTSVESSLQQSLNFFVLQTITSIQHLQALMVLLPNGLAPFFDPKCNGNCANKMVFYVLL